MMRGQGFRGSAVISIMGFSDNEGPQNGGEITTNGKNLNGRDLMSGKSGTKINPKMKFTLDQVAPWGRGFEEYRSMFSLSESDLNQTILGCGDGPSSFNAWLTQRGGRVISVDPLYQYTVTQIRDRIDHTFPKILEQTRNNAQQFNWTRLTSVENLGRVRMKSMEAFLADYPSGRREGRYLEASLPALPFKDKAFDLALCSHLLFLYSDHFSLEFHVKAIKELSRVSWETRIFPLLDLNSQRSVYLEETLHQLEVGGLKPTVETVPYEFQKGGNQMLRIQPFHKT